MGKKSKKIKGGGLVFSTNPETMSDMFSKINFPENTTKGSGLDREIRVWLDRKRRRGKEVTLIKGFKEDKTTLKELSSFLKMKCGVGGSIKDHEIIIQGDHRDKIVTLLKEKGYANVKKAGG